MNILLGVYACEPNKGSEPEVGWQMVNELAKSMPNDTFHAITKANNQEEIEKELCPKNVKFYYYAPPKWLTFWKKGGRGVRIYYYLWMIGAALYMKKQRSSFDIVHHITFVNDWLPSFFYLLKRKENRFIWGPIGSHDPIEEKFLDGNKRKLIEKIRIGLQLFFRNLDPSFYICRHKADCIIGINDNVGKKLKLKANKYFVAEPAIGMKKSSVEKIEQNIEEDDTFLIVSVGRLLYIKNFKLSIISFAKFLKNNPEVNAKLQIIGEGGDRKSLETLTSNLGVSEHVEFVGNIPLQDVQKRFAMANLFLFPTLENAGFVTLEAMSNALPIIAMKYGGPEQFIKHNVEEQLVSSTQSYEEISDDISARIESFYADTSLRKKVGVQNREDILNLFTWEAKAEKMKKIYNDLLEKND